MGSDGSAPLFSRCLQHQLGSARPHSRVSLGLPRTFHYALDLKLHKTPHDVMCPDV